MRIIVIFTLTLLLTSEAISQEPCPPSAERQPREIETKNATETNVKPAKNKNSTTNPLPIIDNNRNAIENNPPAKKSNYENRKHQEAVSNNDPTVWYNFLMMIFTGALVICNILMWLATKKSADAAKIAADAAQKSIDTIPTIERAYIYVSSVFADFESWRHVEGNKRSPIQITVHNYGKTPAKLTDITIEIKVGPSDGRRIYWEDPETDEIRDAVGRFIASSSEGIFNYYTYNTFGDGGYHINFSGEVKYTDIFGKEHTAYFDWALVSRFQRGFYINNPERNYTT